MDTNTSAGEWAERQFGLAELGDRRRTQRLVAMAASVLERPAGKITQVFTMSAQQQGAYGLIENHHVTQRAVAEAAYDATARQAAPQRFVFVPIDDSSFRVVDPGRTKGTGSIGSKCSPSRGFKVMNALAVEPDGTTLGLLGQRFWARPSTRVTTDRHKRVLEEKETARSVNYNGTHFDAELPVDAGPCRGFFDGADVTVEVVVNGTMVVTPRPVNPVPYAKYAEQYGTPDCPVGYERMPPDAATAAGRWFCRDPRRGDDVVRIGDGPSAFWIDRYEATVWDTRDGVVSRGSRLFDNPADVATTFPRDGQWRSGTATTPTSPPAYALSVAGGVNIPARWITWFQAQEACRASGKRLPTGEEWLAAVQGTIYAENSNGVGGQCVTGGGAPGPRTTGGGSACRSGWGAQDMVGNVWEWTGEWYASVRLANALHRNTVPQITVPPDGGTFTISTPAPEPIAAWPSAGGSTYGGDGLGGIVSVSTTAPSTNVEGVPSAAIRGGSWEDGGTRAGVFALDLTYAPTMWNEHFGFRCVIPR